MTDDNVSNIPSKLFDIPITVAGTLQSGQDPNRRTGSMSLAEFRKLSLAEKEAIVVRADRQRNLDNVAAMAVRVFNVLSLRYDDDGNPVATFKPTDLTKVAIGLFAKGLAE